MISENNTAYHVPDTKNQKRYHVTFIFLVILFQIVLTAFGFYLYHEKFPTKQVEINKDSNNELGEMRELDAGNYIVWPEDKNGYTEEEIVRLSAENSAEWPASTSESVLEGEPRTTPFEENSVE